MTVIEMGGRKEMTTTMTNYDFRVNDNAKEDKALVFGYLR
jgi:hypothetical protein